LPACRLVLSRENANHRSGRKKALPFALRCRFEDYTGRKGNALNEFISRYKEQISGVLTGFDRLVFRGNLGIHHEAGMKGYLWANKIAWKEYGRHVDEVSDRVKQASLQPIRDCQRPVQHLYNGKDSKEKMARAIAQRDGITAGPVCAFTAVEPGFSGRVQGNRQSQKLELRRSLRQCLFVYHYWIDAVFGFMSARLQTWFPFALYVYMNGREWLSRQMDRAGLQYQRHDNCFSWIDDFPRAQTLMDDQLKTDWPQALDACAQRAHPLLAELCSNYPMSYYWTCFQSEWAMDIVFRDPDQLRRLYPQLIHLGMLSFSSPDVMRFMDKKVSRKGDAMSSNAHEVVSDLKVRNEGVRIKHRLGKNSIKLYDKAYSQLGAVLRPELTLNAPEQFRVYRRKAGEEQGPMKWRQLRKGVADLHRRAQVSQQALDRYCTALARVDDTTTLRELTAAIEKRVRVNGRSVRALHPFEPGDLALLEAVNRGEFAIHGLRNRDLQALLFSAAPITQAEARRRCAIISRKLSLLRAHGIIQKLPRTHRYQITANGRLILNAVLSAQHTTTQQLTTLAA
jgi:hypothetical protein